MRERKYVKFRVDMYEDTKFKIIDMKPERDVIHYIWSRIVLLAGKVNLEGELYLSKSIPYTMETLAIEFNRDIAQVKAALDLLIELEMLELTEDKVYRVKNFVKHQNIKSKEKAETKNKEAVKNINVLQNESSKVEIKEDKEEKSDDKPIGNAADNKAIIKTDTIEGEKGGGNLQGNIPIALNFKKRKRKNNKEEGERLDFDDEEQESEEDSRNGIIEEARPLRKDDRVILDVSFV